MRKSVLVLLVLLAVAALVVALLPMRLVTSGIIPELEATSATGTVWNGELRGVRYQRVAVGDVDAGLNFASLLRGRPEVTFRRPDGSLQGHAGVTRGARRLRDVSGEVQLSMGRSGIQLALGLEDLSYHADLGGRCQKVSGVVTAQLDSVPVLGSTPAMRGVPRCEGDSLRLPLELEGGGMGLDLLVGRRLNWTAELSVLPLNPLVESAMLLGGFRRPAAGTTPAAGEGALVFRFRGALARPYP